jgi:hypothetical protein
MAPGNPTRGRGEHGPTEEEIVEALARSGYLMEQEVAQLLDEEGYYTTPNEGFIDPDTGEAREYDLHAINAARIAHGRSEVLWPVLLIECKQSESPLVLLTHDRALAGLWPTCDFEKHWSGMPARIYSEAPDDEGEPVCRYLDLSRRHHYWTCKRLSTQFAQLFPKGQAWVAKHGDVYDGAIIPLIKALRHETEKHQQACQPSREDTASNLQIYYLILLWRGPMYEYHIGGDKASLTAAEHVNLVRRYRSRTIDGEFHIDVVAEPHLPSFLRMVSREAENIANLLRRHRSAILKSLQREAELRAREAAAGARRTRRRTR